MDSSIIPILMMLTLVVGLFMGLPLAFVLGGSATLFGLTVLGPQSLYVVTLGLYKIMTSYILVAVPLFIFMATLLERAGVAKGFFVGLRYLFGPVRGGAAIAAIIISTLFAACTGVTGAAIMSVGVLALPVMLDMKYDKALSAGVVGAGGTLGILIPPSIMLVMMGDQSGISVGKLFVGAIVPGLVLSCLYMIYTLVVCYMRPELGPAMSSEDRASMPVLLRITYCVKYALLPLLLILVVLGSIIAGVATPTEAAGIGALFAFIVMIIMRQFSFEKLVESVRGTAKVTAMALLIAAMASSFTAVFLCLGGGELVVRLLQVFGTGKWAVFFMMMLITFVLGMFIDWIGIVFLLFPIFLPVAKEIGFDPVWFVIVMAINLQASFLSPPFGYVLFYLKSISDQYLGGALDMASIYKGVVPFIIIILVSVAIVCIFPSVITWLPEMLIK